MSEKGIESNFEYIAQIEGCKKLGETCVGAEQNQLTDPKESARQCKAAIEEVCRYVCQKEGLKEMEGASLSTMLDHEPLLVALENMDIQRPIRQIRRRSNATANLGEDMEGMPYVVELLFHVVGTMLKEYGKISVIPTYVPMAASFDIPEDLGE